MADLNTVSSPATATQTVENADTGSLHILPAGTERPTVGIRIHIVGEDKPRVTTYIMGSEKKGWFACCKGQGKMPVGAVTFTLLAD